MDLLRYKYEPLKEPKEIRVLELSATKTRIETRILHVPVSSYSFQALSYVWGKPDQENEAIVLDEFGEAIGWIPLTKNLGNAMCDLRDTKELMSKVFWIDQICINQQDEDEKNHQVAIISQIYTHARRVVTYVGPGGPDEEEERGIRLLETIRGNVPDDKWRQMYDVGNMYGARNRIADGTIQLARLPPDLELEGDKVYDEKEIAKRYVEQGWEWLVDVGYGEWLQRMWIVQEQLLNKEITILRGRRLIDWYAVVAIPILFGVGHLPLQYRDTGRQKLSGNSLAWEEVEMIVYGIWLDRYARRVLGTSYTWSPLFQNLVWYEALQCADRRDRVYAILAISRDSADLGLKPDYSPHNTLDVLSRSLSVRLLEKAVDLSLLNYILLRLWPNPTLPSWCLTLDAPWDCITNMVTYDSYTPHPKPLDSHLVRFSSDHSILTLKGRILDYIVFPNAGIAQLKENTSNSPPDEFLLSLMQVLPHGVSIEDTASLFRTLVAEDVRSLPLSVQVNEKEAMAFHLWAYLRQSSCFLAGASCNLPVATKAMLERCDHIMTEIRALAPNVPTNDIVNEEPLAFKRMEGLVLGERRRLGRTRAGRFCNAMGTVQGGDAIVALRGADRLFAIHSVGDAYKLVGDVFVDGLMHGEAYENQDPDEVDCDIELV